jgi:hypothetical protein
LAAKIKPAYHTYGQVTSTKSSNENSEQQNSLVTWHFCQSRQLGQLSLEPEGEKRPKLNRKRKRKKEKECASTYTGVP